MDKQNPIFDEKYKDYVGEYLKSAFDEVVEPHHVRKQDPMEQTVELHIKRNQMLLNEPPQNYDSSNQRTNLYSTLLRIVREKSANRYQHRSSEMMENIRQTFEINTQLQSMLNQSKNEVQRPLQSAFYNAKEFHDESYAKFLEDLGKK